MGKAGLTDRVTVGVITNALQPVAAGPVHAPERATIFGPTKVMMQEIPEVTARSIDSGGNSAKLATSGRRWSRRNVAVYRESQTPLGTDASVFKTII